MHVQANCSTGFGYDAKLAQALGIGFPSKREVDAAMVVFMLPLAELLGQLGRVRISVIVNTQMAPS